MDKNGAAGFHLRAGRREWVGLAVLALPTLLLALDASVLFLALPHLGADLEPSSSQLLWITDIYGFMIAGFLITMGTLGDRIGRRRLLMIGAATFGAASVLAAYSTSAEMLIATRAVLGIAGATLMPSTLALIRNMFRDPRQRSLAIGVWMTSFTAGFLIGPVLGGALLGLFRWGSVFLMGVPVMVLLLVLVPVLLPEYRDAEAGRLDLTSVALSLAAILPIVFGIKQIAAYGLAGLPVLSIVAGVVIGAVFVRRQRVLPDPLLDLRLFSNRAFGAALGIMLLGIGAMVGTELFVAQYLQLVLGLSALAAGLWMMPAAAGSVAGSLLAPIIARRVPPAYVIAAGLAIAAVGLLLLTQVESGSGLAVVVTGFILIYVGLGPMGVLGTDLVLGSALPQKAGSASAMSETSAELGVALGVASLGSIGTAVYRTQVADAIPAGAPPEAAEATRESLAGAVAAADELPAGLGVELLGTAREAFVQALELTAAVSAVVVMTMAILAAVLLRRVRAGSEEQPELEPDGVAVGSAGVEEVLGPVGGPAGGRCNGHGVLRMRTPGARFARGGR
ncbi:MAG TPA: MFS transporter [Actinomycetota bacterium]|nr:MFS transporter [Actinomycetota bacterium]